MLRESGIAWSVIGGESGSKKESRLMTLDDAQYLFTSSEDAGCKVHFKQLGTKLAEERGVYAVGEHRSKGGNLQQIPLNLRKRDWPEPYWEAKYDRHFEPHFDPKELIKFG
jgi:protein gp37